jgi:hypothetical protein
MDLASATETDIDYIRRVTGDESKKPINTHASTLAKGFGELVIFTGALTEATYDRAKADWIEAVVPIYDEVKKSLKDTPADQLKAAAGEANGLGRNDAIGEWSRRTTLVLSYVADAADLTWQTLSVLGRNVAFVFQGVGREIGGIGAQIAAVMRGDFSQARAIGEQIRADAAAARSELDAADARSLGGRQLAGQAMRERMAAMANTAGGYMDRSDRLAAGGSPSTLRAGSGGSGSGRSAARRGSRTSRGTRRACS